MKFPIIIALAISLALASFLGTAAAPSDTPTERKKAHVVHRLYSVTYGANLRCKKATPEAAAEFQKELTRFVSGEANIMKLITQSPHYDSARKQFYENVVIDRARDTPQDVAAECKYLASLLRSLIDTPEGKAAARGYEALLSK